MDGLLLMLDLAAQTFRATIARLEQAVSDRDARINELEAELLVLRNPPASGE